MLQNVSSKLQQDKTLNESLYSPEIENANPRPSKHYDNDVR